MKLRSWYCQCRALFPKSLKLYSEHSKLETRREASRFIDGLKAADLLRFFYLTSIFSTFCARFLLSQLVTFGTIELERASQSTTVLRKL